MIRRELDCPFNREYGPPDSFVNHHADWDYVIYYIGVILGWVHYFGGGTSSSSYFMWCCISWITIVFPVYRRTFRWVGEWSVLITCWKRITPRIYANKQSAGHSQALKVRKVIPYLFLAINPAQIIVIVTSWFEN